MSLGTATYMKRPSLILAGDSRRWCGTCVAHCYIEMLTIPSFSAVSAPWLDSAPWAAYTTSTFESVDAVGVILAIWIQNLLGQIRTPLTSLSMVSLGRPESATAEHRL